LSDARGPLKEEPTFTGQRLVVTLAYRIGATTELACTVSKPADGNRHTITATTGAVVSPVAVGLFATNASAIFRSLAIYE